MSRFKTILLLLFAPSVHCFSQMEFSISGLVTEASGKGLPYANVLLLNPADSTLVVGTLTSEKGDYLLEKVKQGEYIIMSSMLGFTPVYSRPFMLASDYSVESLLLAEGEELQEVDISGTKPLYQQKIDRMVINVERSIVSAGGSALEILERSPGVLVNRQSNSISIVGKEGVVVMINGKMSYVPVNALIQMLEGMAADNIESIELITNPPSNFDAEGNAGYINIVLKTKTNPGLNGSYSLSAGYSDDFITSDNISLNYRNNRINIFGTYSFLLTGNLEELDFSREYRIEEDLFTRRTITERDPQQRNHNLRIGLDYEVSKKTVIGFLVNGYDNLWTMDAINRSFSTINGAPSSYVYLINDEVNHWEHIGGNYNLRHNFTEGSFISFDVDYLYYQDDNPNNYQNTFYSGTRDLLETGTSRSTKYTPIQTWVGKMDLRLSLGARLNLETGAKGTKSNFENDVRVESFDGDTWISDPVLTNKSFLDERIYAGYATLDYAMTDKTTVKAGIRYEFTDSRLDTETEGRVVDRQYGRFFPSLFLNRKFSDSLNMNLSYSRRITRPTFNNLAPFVILLDPNTFVSGNASLQPAISDAVKYDLNYKSFVLSIHYTMEESSIARFQERLDEETGRLILEATNLDYTNTLGATLGFPLKMTQWWRMQNNLVYVYQKVKGNTAEALEQDMGNYSVNSSQFIQFPADFTAEISGFYNSKSFFGTSVTDDLYQVNFGLQKKLGKRGGSLRFSVNDIFDSYVWVTATDLPEQNLRTHNTWDFSTRTYTLTYTNNFGDSQLKSFRNRQTGAEEERRRVN